MSKPAKSSLRKNLLPQAPKAVGIPGRDPYQLVLLPSAEPEEPVVVAPASPNESVAELVVVEPEGEPVVVEPPGRNLRERPAPLPTTKQKRQPARKSQPASQKEHCPECGRLLTRRYMLFHLRLCIGTGRHKCTLCGRCFPVAKRLKSHYGLAHRGEQH